MSHASQSATADTAAAELAREVYTTRGAMNKAMLVLSLLAVIYALTATKCSVMGPLESVMLHSSALFDDVFEAAFFKMHRVYKKLLLLLRVYVLHHFYKEYYMNILLPPGSLPPETSNARSPALAPFEMVDMMRDILTEYEAQLGVSQRSPEATRDARVVMNKAARPVDTAQPGRFEKPVRKNGNIIDWVTRRLAEFPGSRPSGGFYGVPWLDEWSRPVTTKELRETELEMIRSVDPHECMLKLICEVAAEPGRYWMYHFRMVMFFQGLRSLAGENSDIVWRHDNAFRTGFNQFPGNSSMCAKVYDSCR